MVKETSHARVTDPNADLAGRSQDSVIGMLALVAILILLAVAGWSLYDWNSSGTGSCASCSSTRAHPSGLNAPHACVRSLVRCRCGAWRR